VQNPARAQRLDFFLRTIRPDGRTAHLRFIVPMILKLSSGQPVKPGGVLIQQATGLEMQLTAEEFAYRAFHARKVALLNRAGKPDGHFFDTSKT